MKVVNIYALFLSTIILFLISCEEIFLVKDISDQKINLTTPQNDAQLNASGITFLWESLKDSVKYQIQIAKPNFESPLQIVLDTTIVKTTFSKQLPVGKYEWRVKALNSSYETQYSKRNFTIANNDDFQSNTVSLLKPINVFKTNIVSQNLSWESILGAINYQVQIYDGNNSIINDQTVTTTNVNYTFPEGSYNWRVRASNGTNQTFYSSRSIIVDTKIPNTPTLTSPANNSTSSTTSVTFQWTRTDIPGSVENDKIYIYTDIALTNLQQSTIAKSPFTTTLTSGKYYWIVKSTDEAGNTSNQSNIFTITVN
jgi:hypothetical protein